jgi:hypothetical protein
MEEEKENEKENENTNKKTKAAAKTRSHNADSDCAKGAIAQHEPTHVSGGVAIAQHEPPHASGGAASAHPPLSEANMNSALAGMLSGCVFTSSTVNITICQGTSPQAATAISGPHIQGTPESGPAAIAKPQNQGRLRLTYKNNNLEEN